MTVMKNFRKSNYACPLHIGVPYSLACTKANFSINMIIIIIQTITIFLLHPVEVARRQGPSVPPYLLEKWLQPGPHTASLG